MKTAEFINLVLLFLSCLICSVTDIKKQLISNKIILLFLALSVPSNALYYFDSGSAFPLFIADSVLGFALGVGLYVTKAFAGGDSKLLFLVSVLIPVPCAGFPYSIPPILIVILGAFVFGYGFLVFDSIKSLVTARVIFSKEMFAEMPKLTVDTMISLCISFLSIVCCQRIVFLPSFQATSFTVPVITCVLMILLMRKTDFKGKPFILIALVVLDASVALIFGARLSERFVICALLVLLFRCLQSFLDNFSYETIQGSAVSKGMILTDVSQVRLEMAGVTDLESGRRITGLEAESIRGWAQGKDYSKSCLTIVRKMPFAIFLSMGAALWFAVSRI